MALPRPRDLCGPWDVVVVGAGNAGLCAAMVAAEAGRRVLVVESAPRAMRGGNSRHTRNLRAMHQAPTSVLTESYLEDEYWDDLRRVTGGETDEHLARMTIRASEAALPFLEQCGVAFQPSLTSGRSMTSPAAAVWSRRTAGSNGTHLVGEQVVALHRRHASSAGGPRCLAADHGSNVEAERDRCA